MKTIYGKLCDECETVRHCSMKGCIPLVTEEGGRRVNTELPVTMHERPSMLASGWFWLAAVVSGLLWALADWWLT